MRYSFGDRVATPPEYDTTNAHVQVPGSVLDVAVVEGGSSTVGFRVAAAAGNGATVKLVASLDGDTWVDLTARKETGAAQAGAEVAVAAGADEYLFVTPDHDSGVFAAFRYYAVQAKSTVADQSAAVTVFGFAR